MVGHSDLELVPGLSGYSALSLCVCQSAQATAAPALTALQRCLPPLPLTGLRPRHHTWLPLPAPADGRGFQRSRARSMHEALHRTPSDSSLAGVHTAGKESAFAAAGATEQKKARAEEEQAQLVDAVTRKLEEAHPRVGAAVRLCVCVKWYVRACAHPSTYVRARLACAMEQAVGSVCCLEY